MRLLAILCCALALGACSTAPKTYKAPSDAKVRAATTDLNVKVDRARETAKKAKAATEEAAASAQRLVALAKTTSEKIEVLQKKLPAEYKGLADEVKASFDSQVVEEGVGRERTNNSVGWNMQLQNELVAAEKARVTLQGAQDEYANAASSLAQDATNERNFRITAEKQLSREKWMRLLWKLGGGLVVIIIIGLIVLWFTGKLGFKFAK